MRQLVEVKGEGSSFKPGYDLNDFIDMLVHDYVGTEKGQFMVAYRFLRHVQVIDILVGYQSQKLQVIHDRQVGDPENIHPGQCLQTGIGGFQGGYNI